MVRDELLWEMGTPKRLLVSPKSIALLNRLHPTSQDVDMPGRIARWERDWPFSMAEIERYCRAFATRQNGILPA
jgi:hypothetical protein